MNSRLKWLLLSTLCSAILAGGTAWVVTDWTLHRHGEGHAHDHVKPDLHAWMHEHLSITPEQHGKLEPLEEAFEKTRIKLQEEIRLADLELAKTIRDPKMTPAAMDAALERLNEAQGALQRATLEHFFEMKRYLRPAQANKLLEWTHDSLTRH
ncbi:periplasmic heavy metal sensor [Prosthecobacter vanneervenii]|uniref:Spy/CpxP family protein refolding chaperone n=1 Tax=Prosthecobacter vanneervenii TaxID=48466 RepID=A0A7W7Y9V6_9BACT|nr:periplasmic heavy metal sensor [Prosthecobacter vanneervenii]MBB5032266.1 Spy/CpxP family protein refolding chaperone [Prosthecobacter vanneervenii]